MPRVAVAMKKYLVAGLLAWLPLGVTVWLLVWLLGTVDGVYAWLLSGAAVVLPESSQVFLERLRHVPGLSVIVVAAALLATGVFVTNIFGQWVAHRWDGLLHRIPIVKSIYSSVKQVSDTLFSSRTVAPNLGAGVLAALQSPMPPTTDSILTALINEITSLTDDFILVLDDYNVIDAKPVDKAITFLLEHFPHCCTWSLPRVRMHSCPWRGCEPMVN